MALQYLHVLLFTLIGFGFFAFLLTVAGLVRERGSAKDDRTPYECGMEPTGQAWSSPNIRFYVFALLFVIFDVEALFVFPWAVQFHQLGVAGFGAVMAFVAILFFGLIFAWKKGALRWE